MFVEKKRSTRRNIRASEEMEEREQAAVEVAEEATDLLFEAEDVAELLAEVTDQVVEVSVDGDDVIFNVGEDEFVVTPEGDEELVESSTRVMKKRVHAGRTVEKKAPVKANSRPCTPAGRAIRKVRK